MSSVGCISEGSLIEVARPGHSSSYISDGVLQNLADLLTGSGDMKYH